MQSKNSLKKSIEVHFDTSRYHYCIFTMHMMSICEKKISAEIQFIHAEQMSL